MLTPREVEVLQALSAGLSNKAAVSRLSISPHTVKFHIEGLFHKLGPGATRRSGSQRIEAGSIRGLIEQPMRRTLVLLRWSGTEPRDDLHYTRPLHARIDQGWLGKAGRPASGHLPAARASWAQAFQPLFQARPARFAAEFGNARGLPPSFHWRRRAAASRTR